MKRILIRTLIFPIIFEVFSPAHGQDDDGSTATAVILLGGAGVLSSVIYDIATAPKSAERYNESLLSLDTAQSNQLRKSLKKARHWSLGATLIPFALGTAILTAGGGNDNSTTLTIGIVGISSGILIGPSAGHWYAKQTSRGWISVLIRFGISTAGLLLLASQIED